MKELLVETIESLGKCDRDFGVRELVKYLADVSEGHTNDSVVLLKQIFDTHGAGCYFDKASVENILENATKSVWEVRRVACQIVHKLGEYGHQWAQDYLDRLRR